MKKLLFSLLLVSLFGISTVSAGIGPISQNVLNSSGSSTIAVASTGTVYTKYIRFKSAEYFAIMYKATSDGTVNLKIELEQSYAKPSTEGAADTNYVEPEDVDDIDDSVTDEVWHIKTLNPDPLPYGRFKLTGQTGNHSSTTIEIKFFKQEK